MCPESRFTRKTDRSENKTEEKIIIVDCEIKQPNKF